jgi:peptidyl-tRNA hydrolase, PTH2 family
MQYKQVILVRTDLKLPAGKLAAQVAHAAIESMLRSSEDAVHEWRLQGMKKVVLKVKSLEELQSYQQKAKAAKLVASMITDAGLTVVPPGTVTCCGIGPDSEEKIDAVSGDLSIL